MPTTVPTDLRPFLRLEHAAADGSGATTVYISELGRAPIGACPSGAWIPALDDGGESGIPIGPLVQSVEDGRTQRSIAPPGDVRVRVRYTAQTAFLYTRVILGRSAMVAFEGTGPDGAVYTPSAPLVLADGVVEVPLENQPGFYMDFAVRPHPAIFQRVLPRRALLGYPGGALGNGAGLATSVITTVSAAHPTGYTVIPALVSLHAYVLVPLEWDIGASSVHTFCGWRSLVFYAAQAADGYSWELQATFTTDAAGTTETVIGPTITPDEAFHSLVLTLNRSTKAFQFGVDGTVTTAAGVAALYDMGEAFQILRYRTLGTTVTSSVVGAVALWSKVLTAADIQRVATARIERGDPDLELYYPGPIIGGVLYDQSAAQAADPYDAAVTAATAVSMLEGDEGQAGVRLPVVYQAQHYPVVNVEAGTSTYRVSSEPCQEIPRVMDLGVDLPLTLLHDVRTFLTTSPAAGEAAATGWCGGVVKTGSEVEQDRLAVDVLGVSGWTYALGLGTDHNGAYATVSSAINAQVSSGFVLDIAFSWGGDFANGAPVFISNWCRLLHPISPESSSFVVVVYTAGAPTLIGGLVFDRDTWHRVRIEAWNDGAGCEMRCLVDGLVALSGIAEAGFNLGLIVDAAHLAPTFSFSSGSLFGRLSVLPAALWGAGKVSASDAAAEAAHRAEMFDLPDDADPDLIASWWRPTTNVAQVDDETGNGWHATITGGSAWTPGLSASDPLSATVKTLTDYGGLALAAIDIADLAWPGPLRTGIEWAAQYLVAKDEETVAAVASRAMGPGYVLAHPDLTVTLGLTALPSASTYVGTLYAADVWELGPWRLEASDDAGGLPPSVVEALWGQVGIVQQPLEAADATRAALMQREVGSYLAPIGTNAVIYADVDFPNGRRITVAGRYRDRAVAARAAAAFGTRYEAPRWLRIVTGQGGYRAVLPGEVWRIWDEVAKDWFYALILKRTAGLPRDVWEVR